MSSQITPTTAHHFEDSRLVQLPGLHHGDVELEVVQQPKLTKKSIAKEKDRKAVDPPPVVRLRISERADPGQQFMHSPYLFMIVSLVQAPGGPLPPATVGQSLSGTHVSSLHRVKNLDHKGDGAYFVWGDLSVKIEGTWILQFNLYQVDPVTEQTSYITSCQSDPFFVHEGKGWPGMDESTPITSHFASNGVKIRVRREPRSLLKKRGPAADDYQPRKYNKPKLQQSRQADKESSKGDDFLQSQGEVAAAIHAPYTQLPRLETAAAGLGVEEHSFKRSRTASHTPSPSLGQHHRGHGWENRNPPPRMFSDPQPAQRASPLLSQHHQPHHSQNAPSRMYSDPQSSQYGMYGQTLQSNYSPQSFTQPNYSLPFNLSPQNTENPREPAYGYNRPPENILASTGRQRLSLAVPTASQADYQSYEYPHQQQVLTPLRGVSESLGGLNVRSPPLGPDMGGSMGHFSYRQHPSSAYYPPDPVSSLYTPQGNPSIQQQMDSPLPPQASTGFSSYQPYSAVGNVPGTVSEGDTTQTPSFRTAGSGQHFGHSRDGNN
ncbi:velvet factor-domain-containing protein [Bisporella sp. PMI_857]|nr:velvet factor-domain-containing protein [Bisporella sp. PMI_857]KAH8600282.1 velvet factor-domain-containing protein [Bisporella sp. PMI_857]